MGAIFTPNIAGIKKFNDKLSKDLQLTADILAQIIDPEVPFRTGALSMSALQGGIRKRNIKDTDSIKFISYKAPYALKVYYGLSMKFTKDKHPNAKAFWGRTIMNDKSYIERIYSNISKGVR